MKYYFENGYNENKGIDELMESLPGTLCLISCLLSSFYQNIILPIVFPHSYTMGSTYIIPACVIICKRKCVSTNIHFLMSPERVDHLIASAIDMNN